MIVVTELLTPPGPELLEASGRWVLFDPTLSGDRERLHAALARQHRSLQQRGRQATHAARCGVTIEAQERTSHLVIADMLRVLAGGRAIGAV